MVVEIGHFALILALTVSVGQIFFPLLGMKYRHVGLLQTAYTLAWAQFGLVALAFSALIYSYIISDFSVLNVVENSHSLKPLLYKISGTWGNHEGSLLLWVLVLTLCGALKAGALSQRNNTPLLLEGPLILVIQASLVLAFLSYILWSSNPFLRLEIPPPEGQDLNPLLQDPALASHPPFLYGGYVTYSLVFSSAIAGLIQQNIGRQWAREVRSWALGAWILLTIGITLGSYWAYYTLGWGGFWFWDPVENAALLPWLAGTALLHVLSLLEKHEAAKSWAVFLGLLTFSLSLFGTFLVRSGIITSVHTFANDPKRGVFLLFLLLIFVGGGWLLFALKAPSLKTHSAFPVLSRESALLVNNLFLCTLCATVFIGTLYPLVLEAVSGAKISVGAPYFNLTGASLFLPLAICLPFGQNLFWGKNAFFPLVKELWFSIFVGAGVAFYLSLYIPPSSTVLTSNMAPLLVGLAFFLVFGSFHSLYKGMKEKKALPLYERLSHLPLTLWGSTWAHAGVGITLLGIASMGWWTERLLLLRPGENLTLGPWNIMLEQIYVREQDNYIESVAPLTIRSAGSVKSRVEVARRLFPSRQMVVHQAGIATLQGGQIYATMGNVEGEALEMHLQWKPGVLCIWLGGMAMAAGGVMSFLGRFRSSFARKRSRL